MITIDTIIINDIHELADWANSMYHNVVSYDNLNSIAIVAKYYEAKTLIETLIAERGFEISSIKELGDSNVNGYTDEYIKSNRDFQKTIHAAAKAFMFLRIAILR